MDKIELEILGLSSSQSQSGSFALVLGEAEGNRRLPIIIGMFEAQAIAIEIEKIVPNRPMTHDLFRSFADSFGFNIKEILISDLKEGVFYAKLICDNGSETIEVDSRPSDAIAIALRFNAPIFTYEPVLSEAGIILTDTPEEKTKKTAVKKAPSEKKAKTLENTATEELKKMLDDTIGKEDYEKAAKIRDELNRRN